MRTGCTGAKLPRSFRRQVSGFRLCIRAEELLKMELLNRRRHHDFTENKIKRERERDECRRDVLRPGLQKI